MYIVLDSANAVKLNDLMCDVSLSPEPEEVPWAAFSAHYFAANGISYTMLPVECNGRIFLNTKSAYFVIVQV